MKKMNEKLLAGVLAVSALAGSLMTSVAHAEVSASVGAANMYYWRGYDLGLGSAAVWGDLKASADFGLYGGLWASSGDIVNGTEYDLYLGYGTKFGDSPFGIDVSYWTYAYPTIEISPADLAEIVIALTAGPVVGTYYHGISDLEDYSYFTLAASAADFTFKVGKHMDDRDFSSATPPSAEATHLDITYAYNDKLSFTLGKVTDDDDGAVNDEAKFVINLVLPIE